MVPRIRVVFWSFQKQDQNSLVYLGPPIYGSPQITKSHKAAFQSTVRGTDREAFSLQDAKEAALLQIAMATVGKLRSYIEADGVHCSYFRANSDLCKIWERSMPSRGRSRMHAPYRLAILDDNFFEEALVLCLDAHM